MRALNALSASLSLALAGVLLMACGARTPPAPRPAVIDLGQQHPLRGKIYDARAERFIDEPTLITRLHGARYVLLGERHDNPRHHVLQARVLDGLVQRGRRPAVAWEMITDAEQEALETYLASAAASADGLGPAVRWQQRGWPSWSTYQPLAEVALRARLSLAAAGLDRSSLFGLIHAERQGDIRLPETAHKDLARTIRASHCGHATGRMLRMMVLAQQTRDAHMARRILTVAPTTHQSGCVLIAGNGHVRRDRGVPFYLHRASKDATTASLGLIEVAPDDSRAASYTEGVEGLGPAYDYVWFTQRVDNVDPCVKFRQQLRKIRKKH